MESLNMQLQPFFEWLLRTTLQASLLICLILLFQAVLRNKLGARWHYCLWLLLLIRMAMPWAPQSRVSVFNLIPQSLPQRQTEYIQQDVGDDSADSDVADKSTAESTPFSTTEVVQDTSKVITVAPETGKEAQGQLKPVVSEIANILPLIWLTGALALAVYVCASNFNLLRIVKRERPLTDQKILDLLEDCKAEMGIRIILGVVATDKVTSPALFGFIRPRLLLPKGMLETLSREELRYVFLHELAHLKRHDIYIGWLISLLQVLHWFNPLIWLAFYRLRADRELACDALVLARTQSSQAKDYGRTIVSLLERFSRSQPLPAMAGILETKAQLKRRITMIARFKKNSYQWSPLAVILVIILACVSLPDAKRTRASETLASKPAHQPKFTKIRIPTEISWDMHLSPDGQKVSIVSDKKLWIMSLVGQLGPDIPGAPVELDTEDVRVEWTAHTWSGDSKWIAFNEYPLNEMDEENKGSQGIYIVSTEGGKPKKVYENYRDARTVNYRISLSPSGKTLAFSSVDLERSEQHIYTIPVDGGSPKQLVDVQAREPVFSPDGKMIAFVEDKNLGRGGGDLWVIPAQGGTPKHVVDAVNASSPVWSPNGDMIAFLDDGNKRNQINFIPIGENGEAAGDLITIDAPEGIDGIWLLAGWSPDNKIGAIFERGGETGLYILPTKGGKAMQVARGGGQPRWSPDGKRIFCVNSPNERSGAWQRLAIGSIPAEGGSFTTIPIQSDVKIYIPYFGVGNRTSPDGKMIVFSGKTQKKPPHFLHNSIWTLPVEGGKPKQLTEASEQTTDMHPCWSPDGRAIAFVRARIPKILVTSNVKTNIFIVQANGGEPIHLTTESDSVIFGPIEWSPDGKFIAYFSQQNDTSGSGNLSIISANGDGKSRVIGKVRDPHPGMQFAWSPDSKRIAFDGPDGKVIKVISLEDGSIVNIETGLVDSNIGDRLDWSPDGERFVFVGGKGESSEFWMIENFLPGAPVAKPEPVPEPTLRRIEVRGRGRVHSKPSFDGKYFSDVDSETDNLIIRELATGKERILTKNSDPNWFAYDSRISRDSEKVAFYYFNPDKEDFDLRIVGLDGSNLRTLLGAEIAGYFNMDAWSPDGKYIFGKLMKKPVQLVRLSTDDGSIQVLKTFDQGRASRIDVSPDGRYIAYSYAEQETSNPDIFVFDLEENRETPLVKHPANDKLLGWTPDGQHVFFTSDRNGTWDGWLLRVEDGKPRGLPEVIKAGIGDVSPIGFTRSGSFYHNFRHEVWNVYTAKLDLDTGEAFSAPSPVRHVGKDIRPDWSPDGRYLAYCSERDRNKPQVVRIRTLATGQERELKTELPHFDWLRWCPDSRHLLITNFNRGSPSVVYKLDVQTGEHTALVQSDEQRIRQVELSADGKTLAYRIRGLGNANRLIVRDMETGREKELLGTESMGAAALLFWALSPDGKHVALSVREGEVNRAFVLKIISVASGEARTVVGDSVGELAWTSDGRDLLFVKGFKELWRVSAEGGEPRKLWEWKQMLWGLRIHPDGQRIAFFSGGNVSEMWVMENFLPTGVSQAK